MENPVLHNMWIKLKKYTNEVYAEYNLVLYN